MCRLSRIRLWDYKRENLDNKSKQEVIMEESSKEGTGPRGTNCLAKHDDDEIEVSEELGITQSVISRLWQRLQDDGNVRCYSTGHPQVTTPTEDRYLAVTAKRNRRSTAWKCRMEEENHNANFSDFQTGEYANFKFDIKNVASAAANEI
ncbi:transposable element Tcb1 transposase [Trichonephila clavipes]|nr:transposable element Tcb1 transposase [Trichonephila clavipes]